MANGYTCSKCGCFVTDPHSCRPEDLKHQNGSGKKPKGGKGGKK